MSNEVERRHESAPRRKEKTGRRVLAHLWHMLRHNLGWKVLALFLAVGLWAGLITQDPTLTREKTFVDVQVSINGLDTLKRNGFIEVGGINLNPPSVRLKVDVPQKEYANVTASNYNVRVDLSRINGEGVQTLKISATSTSTYGTVVEIVPDTLEVQVERYTTRFRIPVTIVQEGEPPLGYFGTDISIDPPTVAISGPESLLKKVIRAVAVYDQSILPARAGLVRSSIPFELLDDMGEPVSSDLIEVTSESVKIDSVVVGQTLYETKTIDLSQAALTAGSPAAGYQVKSISVTPSQIVAAGRPEALEAVENLFLESPVNISNATETMTAVIKVQKPAEIVNLSSTSVTVTVEIEPVRVNRSFENIRVTSQGLGEGYSAALDKTRASVTLNGPQLWLEKLKASDISVAADLTGLEEGIHSVPLLCTVAGGETVEYTYATDPAMVQATITIK